MSGFSCRWPSGTEMTGGTPPMSWPPTTSWGTTWWRSPSGQIGSGRSVGSVYDWLGQFSPCPYSSHAFVKQNQDLIWSLSGRDDFDDSSHPLYSVDIEITDRVTEIAAKVENKTDPEIMTLQSEVNFALDVLWILGSALTTLYWQN